MVFFRIVRIGFFGISILVFGNEVLNVDFKRLYLVNLFIRMMLFILSLFVFMIVVMCKIIFLMVLFSSFVKVLL